MKSRVAVIFVVLALLVELLAICAPAARAQSGGEVVLHSFDGSDGAFPGGGLTQGSDGNFYGTAGRGANQAPFPNGAGTVFQLTPSGTLTTLYSFCGQAGCTDGYRPFAGLIQGRDGNFYGTTGWGGANQSADSGRGGGTAFKLTTSGTLTTLYSFCSQANCADGYDPTGGVIQGTDGNFYGTTENGGANNDGTVFKLTPSGTLTTLHSFCSKANCADGIEPLAGVIQGNDGNFYGTTAFGGAKNDGTVFKLTPSGTLTTLHSFCSKDDPRKGCLDGQNPYAGVVQGSDGKFYGTTTSGGAHSSYGTVFKLTLSGTLTTLYSFCSVGETSDGGCLDGYDPIANMIQGSDGNFYGTTNSGGAIIPHNFGTVFMITTSGKLTTLYSFCSVGDPSMQACLDGNVPDGLIEGGDGNLYGATVYGGANRDGTVFEFSPPPTLTPGHIKVVPKKLTLTAEPNATASASITIENTSAGPVTVDISEPKNAPPFSEVGGGSSILIGPGDDYQVTITYSPTSSTTRKEKRDSIGVKTISNDPSQKEPIKVMLKGEK
jgi:uncharacterized repeat protein (TIGR03803 family)